MRQNAHATMWNVMNTMSGCQEILILASISIVHIITCLLSVLSIQCTAAISLQQEGGVHRVISSLFILVQTCGAMDRAGKSIFFRYIFISVGHAMPCNDVTIFCVNNAPIHHLF